MKKEKDFSNIFLELCNSLTEINKFEELIGLLNVKLKILIEFDDIYISIYNSELKSIVNYGFTFNQSENTYIEKKYNSFSEEGSLFNFTQHRSNSLINKFEIEANKENFWELQLLHLIDTNEIGIIKLHSMRKQFGILVLSTKKQINPNYLKYFDQIGTIVSLCVSKIICSNELQLTLSEELFLLNLSEKFAQVSNREQLNNLIIRDIQPLFDFNEHFSITVINHRNNKLEEFDLVNYNYHESHNNMSYNFNKYFIDKFKANRLIIDDIDFIHKPHNNLYEQNLANKWESYNFKYSLSSSLLIANELIGVFHVFFYNDKYLSAKQQNVFIAISNQLAIAISKIVSLENLLTKDREKDLLFAISKNLVKVTTLNDLIQFVKTNLGLICEFPKYFQLSVFNTGMNYYKNLFDWNDLNLEVDNDYFDKLKLHLIEDNQIFNLVTLSKSPLVFEYEDFKKKTIGNDDYKDMEYMEFNNFLAYRLYSGDSVIGVICLITNEIPIREEAIEIFQSIGDQFSVVLKNLMLNLELISSTKKLETMNTQLIENKDYLVEEKEDDNYYIFEGIVGASKLTKKVNSNIQIAANNLASVLITGETGTGKELVANAIHNLSNRKNKPFIKINCASIPLNLLESELFGHEKGAFTGAFEKRIGKFELANGGTILLDEIGEISYELQAKLLRILQEREFERVGSNKVITTDVRIIASTNRNLEEEINKGNFRKDLFYRLNVFPIQVPPLRERKEDILVLTNHFISKYNKKYSKIIKGISSNSIKQILSYNWPGNIRELEHVIERAVILSKSNILSNLSIESNVSKDVHNDNNFNIKPLIEHEKEYITFVLKTCSGKVKGKGGAAEILNIPPTTLFSKMQKLGIKKEDYK